MFLTENIVEMAPKTGLIRKTPENQLTAVFTQLQSRK